MTDISKVQDWSALSLDDLERAVRFHNHAYWIDNNAVIPDEEFDKLVEALRVRAPASEVLSAIGPAGADVPGAVDADKVRHEPPMLSLDKCYDEETLLKWFGKFEGRVIVSPKVDGVAGSIRYDTDGRLTLGATRGNGVLGEDITENVRRIVNLPERINKGPLEVRGEAYMPLDIFRSKFQQDYSSPRNLTAGALKQKDPEKTADFEVHFFAYDAVGPTFDSEHQKMEWLADQGFTPVETEIVTIDALQDAYDAILERRNRLNFDTDGVVYKVDDTVEQERMGHTAHHPRFAIAYKFQGDSGQSVLREVHWSISRTGAINPVGIVDPIDLSGATVTRCSLHNLAIMEKLGGEGGLTLNSQVLMVRRGGVIPHLEKVIEPGDSAVEIPTQCPFCGAPTFRESDVLQADHAADCRGSRLKQIEHFADVLEIKGFGPRLIEALYEAGFVSEPADFFTLTVDQLTSLDRVGEKLAKKLIGRIDARRTVRVETFLRSLGIDELGNHVSKILARHYNSLDEILSVTANELSAIHTIGDVIAETVTSGFTARRQDIEDLTGHLKLEFPTPEDDTSQGPLAGISFLFTGALESMTRKEAQEKVRDGGGETPSSVTQDLNFLVIGDADLERFNDGWRTSKLKKAESYREKGRDIEIIGESRFLELISESS